MRITFIDYTEDSLSDRKISKEIIKDAILNPDEIVEGKKGRKIAHKVIENKLLRIIYEVAVCPRDICPRQNRKLVPV